MTLEEPKWMKKVVPCRHNWQECWRCEAERKKETKQLMKDTTITIKQLDSDGYSVEVAHGNYCWWKPINVWEIAEIVGKVAYYLYDCEYDNIDEVMTEKGFKNYTLV